MRILLKELLEKLSIERILHSYETQPWSYYDEEKAITCSAEVRMGIDQGDMEAEIQFLYDDPPEDKPPLEQIQILKAAPSGTDKWAVKSMLIKGKSYEEELSNWEEKGCEFFAAVVECLERGELPDIDELIDSIMTEFGGFGGGRRGRVGRKSPKVNQAALLGAKPPGGKM